MRPMVGTRRKTIGLLERGSREMTWDTCMNLTLLFVSNPEILRLMPLLGIDADAMKNDQNVSSYQNKKQSESGGVAL